MDKTRARGRLTGGKDSDVREDHHQETDSTSPIIMEDCEAQEEVAPEIARGADDENPDDGDRNTVDHPLDPIDDIEFSPSLPLAKRKPQADSSSSGLCNADEKGNNSPGHESLAPISMKDRKTQAETGHRGPKAEAPSDTSHPTPAPRRREDTLDNASATMSTRKRKSQTASVHSSRG